MLWLKNRRVYLVKKCYAEFSNPRHLEWMGSGMPSRTHTRQYPTGTGRGFTRVTRPAAMPICEWRAASQRQNTNEGMYKET